MKPQNTHNSYFQEAYKRLNAAQKEAVDTIEGPVVVIAGPGTGKTQVLALRIAHILEVAGAGVGPENILALTFTNAGVLAMRKRLEELTNSSTAYLTHIFTFHSFAEEKIREYPEFFGGNAFFRPASELTRLQIIEKIIHEGDFSHLKTFGSETHATKAVLSAIDTLKQEGITENTFDELIENQEKETLADEKSYYQRNGKGYVKGDMKPDALKHVHKNKELSSVYKKYQGELIFQKLLDFNDILLQFIRALEDHAEFQAALATQYQYILVDEHQDTNGAQNRILELLTIHPAGDSPNIFTVGDEKQAIYRFQGASVENFLAFAERFADTKIIHLTDNYRSSQEILDAAHALISHNTSVALPPVPLVAATTLNHENLSVQTFGTYQEELWFLAEDIQQKIAAGVAPEEIAVLYIENKFLRDIQEVFEKQGIEYRVSSKQNLLSDPVIQKLVLMLRAAADPMNDEVFGETLLLDVFGLNHLDVLTLFDEVRYGRKKKHLISCMKYAHQQRDVFQEGEVLANVAEKFLLFHKKGNSLPFLEFLDLFIRESGYLKYILSLPTQALHLEQIATLLHEIKKQVQEQPRFRLENFLGFINTLLTYDLAIEAGSVKKSGVQLMTAHGSKGLEFEHVYILHVAHGRWSQKKRMQHFRLPLNILLGGIEDERRLLYVALTRGKKNVTFLFAHANNDGRPELPSMFLKELPEGIMQEEKEKIQVSPEVLFAPRVVSLPKLTEQSFIHQRFLETKLSATALNNYFRSPLLYFFRNLIRIPSSQTKTLLYGNVIHKTLEVFFQEMKQKKSSVSEGRLLEIFQSVLEGEHLLHEYYEEFQKRGEKNLALYYQNYQDIFTGEVETEKKITGVTLKLLTGEELMLTGIIDKIEYLPGGTVRVVDYKTGKSWSEKNKVERELLRRQIVFYKLLLDNYQEGEKSFKMVEGVLDFVEPNKKGSFERETIVVTEEDVVKLTEEIQCFAEEVLTGEFLRKDFSGSAEAKPFLEFLTLINS